MIDAVLMNLTHATLYAMHNDLRAAMARETDAGRYTQQRVACEAIERAMQAQANAA